jgi:S1-C subfamily serine protease
MKTLIFTAALPLLACATLAQVAPPPSDAIPETIKKARAGAWLGIELTEEDGKVLITGIAPDSPAAKAGLQKGDIVLRIGDTAVEGRAERLVNAVTEKQSGDVIALSWKRQRGSLEDRTRGPAGFAGERLPGRVQTR